MGDSVLRESLKAVASLAPYAKARKTVGDTWFGRLFGQATAAILLILGYLAAIGLLYGLIGEQLRTFHRTDPIPFWAALGLPLLGILLFQIVPDALKVRRERRLHALLDNPAPPKPGYFRLHPYGEGDAARYSRPDDALVQALGWIEGTPDAVLYLGGASGTGKSSLVAAGLTPALTAKGWHVLMVRGMGAPLASLTAALHGAEHLYAEKPHRNTGARTLLERAAAERERAGSGPLLVILDQFEEYLILDGGEDRAAYADFLRGIAEDPIAGVRLLHVFRSDYEPLIFKQDLPDMIPRRSGFSLAGFTRREAQAFLEGGPRRLEAGGYDALFRGLDRIEETRGLYRPITLNMIGFVLEREGGALAGDPGALIERYLADCLARGDAQDAAQPVLNTLITSAGTREPRTEAAVADAAGLAPWQARATLTTLERDGLVRPLEGSVWEISHDFLARLMGRMLGRVKSPWFGRARTGRLAVAGLGWLAALGLAVPLWSGIQTDRVLREIGDLGFDRSGGIVDGYGFRLDDKNGFTQADFIRFGMLARGMPITALNLSLANGITDLAPLEGMPITSLYLSGADGITDLAPLEGMPITSLNLRGADGITDLAPLEGMPITSLYLSDTYRITTLAPLRGIDPSVIRGASRRLLATLEPD